MFRRVIPVFCCSLMLASPAVADIQYTVLDLGASAGGSPLQPMGLNNNGLVLAIEFSFGPQFGEHTYLLSGQGRTELRGTNGERSLSRSLNDSGISAGYSSAGFFSPTVGAIWNANGGITELTLPVGGASSLATSINAGMEVVGMITMTDGSARAARWAADGSPSLLPQTDSLRATRADVITDNGTVFGRAVADPDNDGLFDEQHLVQWSNGVMQDLGIRDCQINGANNAGTVLCNSSGPNGLFAYLYSASGEQGLPLLSGATGMAGQGIAENGDVVGTSFLQDGFGVRGVASAWLGGTPYDLNQLIDATLGWDLISAGAINEKGQIAAWGRLSDGSTHALLLTPVKEPGGGDVAEPGSVALLLLAVSLAAHRGRKYHVA